MTHTTHIAPLDLATSGRLPHIVQAAEERLTARAGAVHIATGIYTEALKHDTPASTLDNICNHLGEIMPEVLGAVKLSPEGAEVMHAAITDTMRAFTVVEHARQAADPGYRYVFEVLADALKRGVDPATVRAEVPRVVAKLAAQVDIHLEAVAAEYEDCPRCRNKMDLPGHSRATPERDIEICGPCCSDEAEREAAGLPWPAVSAWPVARNGRA